jgi:YebC/PmpR family DNA-binding regulatory protein
MGRAYEYRKERIFKRNGNLSRMCTKYGKDITIAVRSGGPNLDTNSKLRAIIQNARQDNMPKETIERAIKKASSKDEADLKEMVYEGYAPHGVAILVETATDNPTRTVANIRSYLTKFGGTLGTSGMLDFLFERKCRFKIKKDNVNLEEFELEMIDYGADEMFEVEDGIMIYGPFAEFGTIQKQLEAKKIEIANAEFVRIPNDLKELTPEQAADIEKIIDRIEEDDDVQRVYHNMK